METKIAWTARALLAIEPALPPSEDGERRKRSEHGRLAAVAMWSQRSVAERDTSRSDTLRLIARRDGEAQNCHLQRELGITRSAAVARLHVLLDLRLIEVAKLAARDCSDGKRYRGPALVKCYRLTSHGRSALMDIGGSDECV